MRGSIQRTIIFVWIQALLGQFPMWNMTPEARVNCAATGYGQA